jgi:hypothetical protein
MTDGDIDYSKFSRAQLEDALSRIDRDRYPRNYESLVKELGVRPVETPVPRQRDMRNWVTLIGWYQIVATAVFCYDEVTSWTFDISDLPKLRYVPLSAQLILSVSLLLVLCLLVIPGIAGVLTVRGRPLGPRLSIVTFGAQVISVTVPGFSYQGASLFALALYWSSARFGITASLGHDIKVSLGGSDPVYIAVDLFALTAIVILVRFIRRGLPANNRWRGP